MLQSRWLTSIDGVWNANWLWHSHCLTSLQVLVLYPLIPPSVVLFHHAAMALIDGRVSNVVIVSQFIGLLFCYTN
ncbi:MAG: hypothetical protein ACTS4Y_01110 [Candidatus Hodgkinia cicadicola]